MNMSRCEQRRSIGNDQAAECYHYPLNRCVKLKRNAFKCAQAANELSYCNNKPDTAVSLHNCVMASVENVEEKMLSNLLDAGIT
ncbi:hypothetical protein T4D_16356 [Trichinella pseudospiralis]|uniref:Uncharacterized protein n=1 Tax=Trichinella pseudospiralis TaxID=6337 RepID=A0A0V1G1Z2_TRIPS|nr:hypothetical protein T4D_16356 [Trichinella pseudospiralis]